MQTIILPRNKKTFIGILNHITLIYGLIILGQNFMILAVMGHRIDKDKHLVEILKILSVPDLNLYTFSLHLDQL